MVTDSEIDPGNDRCHPARTEAWRSGFALDSLRIGLGLIWALNLLFVVDPANDFYATFALTAQTFSGSSIGGAALPLFVSRHAAVFAPMIAGATAYLAVSLTLGFTTRLAYVIGFAFNSILLFTQISSLWVLPGGTDVGPQPLYLLLYAGLYLGRGSQRWSIDAKLRRAHSSNLPGHSELTRIDPPATF